ncbi:MAG: RpiB/LacA/LacB family sugar-phosphate isomerase [Candidatus Liptonbacteria bacterium]|nr:RpiB/LacA/LacB family sugar-phosphate isomerase [Candidatus Liptonbacteria bacterium]
MTLKVFLGADHRGFALKERIKAWLAEAGYAIEDMGAHALDASDDYPDFGLAVGREVAKNPEEHRGILFCGSGIGIAIAANKVRGVRASLVTSPELARAARNDEDLNVLSLSADHTDEESARRILEAFLSTPFSAEERHRRRKDKITRAEHAGSSSN